MGRVKAEIDRIEQLRGQANSVLLQAGAIKACEIHSDVLIDQYDAEALSHAYAIGTNRWKAGEIDAENREEFMDAIKEAYEASASERYYCVRHLDD